MWITNNILNNVTLIIGLAIQKIFICSIDFSLEHFDYFQIKIMIIVY